MPNDVIEEMAREMAELNDFTWEHCAQVCWRDDARAAARVLLKRLREPSEGMLDELYANCHKPEARYDRTECYRRMLDQFAKENGINE